MGRFGPGRGRGNQQRSHMSATKQDYDSGEMSIAIVMRSVLAVC